MWRQRIPDLFTKRKLQAILCAFILPLPSVAQDYYFQPHFLLRKNEDVSVNSIYQGKKGFLWFGTKSGLFRYDGIECRPYSIQDSLPCNDVTALTGDASGRVWIGCRNGKIAFEENGRFQTMRFDEGDASSAVTSMLFDHGGRLWFSTLGDGIYYVDNSRLYRLDETDDLPDLNVYDLAIDSAGNIWAGTDQGIAICSYSHKSIRIKTLDSHQGLPDNIVRTIRLDGHGTAWLGTEDKGVVTYSLATGAFSELNNEWSGGAVTSLLLSGDKVWIGCAGKGLLVYDRSLRRISSQTSVLPDYLAGVQVITEDHEGNMWIGSSRGLVQSPGDLAGYINVEGGKDANVLAVAVDKQGDLWYATRQGLFRRSTDAFGHVLTSKPLEKTSLKNFPVVSLYADNAGYVWAGFYGEGVVRIHSATGSTRYLKKELANGNVLNISGKDSTVWLATLGGATRIQVNDDRFTLQHFNEACGLSSDYIYQVFTDSHNRTWFATDGKGADMLDHAGIHHFTSNFKSKVIYGFAEDFRGTVWAQAQADGLYRFNGQEFVPDASGLTPANERVSILATDTKGRLVMMHDFGIEILDPLSANFRSVGAEDGMGSRKPNLNAVAASGDAMWFGTDGGIVVLSQLSRHLPVAPRPYLDGLRVVNRPMAAADNMEFNYNENDITLNYLGFWYQDPEGLHYRYKLEQFDKDWITSRNRSATYSSLPPGSYKFNLEVSKDPSFRKAQATSLSFVIRPPFWRTAGFYAFAFATIILLVYAYITVRERKLRADKKILEEKNAELKKTNMELDRFVYSVSHDLRAPLSSMLGIVNISEEETKDELQLHHLGILKASILKLDGFIHDILDYSRNARQDIGREPIDFRAMLSSITESLQHAGKKVPEINVSVQGEAQFISDPRRLDVVLNNVISNAIRYQKDGIEQPRVDISVQTSANGADIVVSDNGIGIAKEDQGKIFDMFYRAAENSVGSGLGLYIVKETVDRLKGIIEVISEPGLGTSFRISLPNT